MMMTNYHTHTLRCKHAKNTDEEYVQAALKAGYGLLGFSDHSPWPYESGYVSGIRMDPGQLPEYMASIRALREKYADRIDIKVGLECEYFPAYLGWIEKQVEKHHINFLLLGNHSDLTDDGGFYFGDACEPAHIRTYTERTIAAMRTGLFSYLAHPDLVMRGYKAWDAACDDMAWALCETALQMRMPLEYNLMGNEYKKMTGLPWSGIGYPDDHFWRIAAKAGCTAIIGLDSHRASHLLETEEYTDAVAYLDGLGMKRIETFTLLYDE